MTYTRWKMSRGYEIYKKVLDAMQEAEEIDGVEGIKYLRLMLEIQDQVQKRFNNCVLRMLEDKYE
jgi:hypothetical protein